MLNLQVENQTGLTDPIVGNLSKLASHFCCEAGAIPARSHTIPTFGESSRVAAALPPLKGASSAFDAIGRSPVPEDFTF